MTRLVFASAATAALLLSGCGTLLGGGKKATLYRFGDGPAPVVGPVHPREILFLPPPIFDPAADGDRILTVSGNRAAYLAGARWLTPAPTMFAAAVKRHIESVRPEVDVETGRSTVQPDHVMRINVASFEARYDNGDDQAPVVVIVAHMSLDAPVGGKATPVIIEERERAADNRASAVTMAFGAAVDRLAGRLAVAIPAAKH